MDWKRVIKILCLSLLVVTSCSQAFPLSYLVVWTFLLHYQCVCTLCYVLNMNMGVFSDVATIGDRWIVAEEY